MIPNRGSSEINVEVRVAALHTHQTIPTAGREIISFKKNHIVDKLIVRMYKYNRLLTYSTKYRSTN